VLTDTAGAVSDWNFAHDAPLVQGNELAVGRAEMHD
jgi:hypothetical protein